MGGINLDTKNRRILVIDDSEAIHTDFRRILDRKADTLALDDMEASLFGSAAAPSKHLPSFHLTSTYQGQEGLSAVRQARAEGHPYALAFVDMRMPPGWDGLETLARVFQEDPMLQAVLCSAYSDATWENITERLGPTDRLLILKKPFDPIEVRQAASALTEKWNQRSASARVEAALRASEAQSRALLDALPDTMVRVDRDGMCLTVRTPHEVTTPPSQPLFSPGRPISETLPADAGERMMLAVERTQRGGPAEVFELTVTEDGQAHEYEARVLGAGEAEALVLLRDIGERKRAQAVAEEQRAMEAALRAQANALMALSTPLIPISDEIVVMPLIGAMDAERMRRVEETLVNGVSGRGASVAILDITGVPAMNAEVADAMVRLAHAVRLLGARLFLTGLRPDVAQTLVSLNRDLHGIVTHRTLQSGVTFAMAMRRRAS